MSTTVPDIPVSALSGYSEVAEIVAGRPLYHFGDVVSFSYHRRAGGERDQVWPSIELVMQGQVAPHRKIGFRFSGVRDVQFSGWGSIVGLYFQSIKDRGWEMLALRLATTSRAVFTFIAMAFQFLIPNESVNVSLKAHELGQVCN